MRGNTAIFKCQIPSFVADHVDLMEWTSTENDTYTFGSDYGSSSFEIYGQPSPFIFDFILLPHFKFVNTSCRSAVRRPPAEEQISHDFRSSLTFSCFSSLFRQRDGRTCAQRQLSDSKMSHSKFRVRFRHH